MSMSESILDASKWEKDKLEKEREKKTGEKVFDMRERKKLSVITSVT